MQRLPRTFRLFQVLAIIKSTVLFTFLGLLVSLMGCSNDPGTIETSSEEEIFETIPSSECDSLEIGNYSILLPKKLSSSYNLNYHEIASLSNLFLEIHCSISIIAKDREETIPDSTFKTLCDSYIEQDKRKFNGSSEVLEHYSSQVNSHASNYTRLKSRSFGFPLDQSISYRFIQFDAEIVTIMFWTPFAAFEKWAGYEDVITSSLRQIKKD